MQDPKNVTILAAHLAARGVLPHHAARCAEQMERHGEALSHIAVRRCNEGDLPALMRRETTIRGLAAADFAQMQMWTHDLMKPRAYTKSGIGKLEIQFGGDPRGHVLRIIGLPGNTWGGDESGFGL